MPFLILREENVESMVSKERARKTKQRHRQAEKGHTQPLKLLERPVIGIATAMLTWAIMFGALRTPTILNAESWITLWTDALIGLAAFIAAAMFLNILEPGIIRRNSRIALISIILILTTAAGALTLKLDQAVHGLTHNTVSLALPFILAPLLTTLLISPGTALAVGIVATLTLAIFAGQSFTLIIMGLLATTFITQAAWRTRTRSRIIRMAMLAGIIQLLPVIITNLLAMAQVQPISLIQEAAASILGAVFSALIALLVLPALEHIFNITSDISLLEFSDLGHPLLQRLALEAPGTYHHSLVVANIAQAAADAIGANSIEARVSSYFHDIGKLTKPNFFAENIHLQNNPHDDLSPSMSTLIITSHVKEGLSLAMLHKLPEPVHRAIREHHGTSVLQCFHHKAVTQQQELDFSDPNTPPKKIDDHSFRYQGPRPSTKVSGIICLADAVEAASRSLEKPTPGHIEGLVADIVRKRMDDGQLDECELSLLELSKIRRAFVFTLTNMLHGRIAYPDHENNHTESSKTNPAEPENANTTV